MLTDVFVPGNRWDLLAPYPVPRPQVSVVVTHYEQPDQLARTWAALCAQTLPPAEVVITDDGSAEPPRAPAGGPPVRVVTQPDLGFRAAAARNAGARAARGEVLVFVDADTVPGPGFVEAMTRRVAVCPDVLAVGRRRHADLAATPVGSDPAAAPPLPDPAWLRHAYTASRDLLDADGRSFRFVISAVLACRRSLFDDLGGFDERFVGYGGEDWDLAYRAWNAGAVLVHEPDAVAWHDGPDWAGRDGGAKDLESVRLAALVPEPVTRGVALPGGLPDVLVDLACDGVPATVRTVHALLAQDHRDLRVRLPGPVDPLLVQLYGSAVQQDAWSADQRRRARAVLTARAPLPAGALTTAMGALVDDDLARVVIACGGDPVAEIESTRARGRIRRWAHRLPADVVRGSFGCAVVDAGPAPRTSGGLDGYFARLARP